MLFFELEIVPGEEKDPENPEGECDAVSHYILTEAYLSSGDCFILCSGNCGKCKKFSSAEKKCGEADKLFEKHCKAIIEKSKGKITEDVFVIPEWAASN